MSELSEQTTHLSTRKFLTAGQAAAASDALRDEMYKRENDYETSASNTTDQGLMFLEKIETFIELAVRSGRVMYFAPDRLLVQTLVTNWQGEADHLRRKTNAALAEGPKDWRANLIQRNMPVRLLEKSDSDDPDSEAAINAQRDEQTERELMERASRWEQLRRVTKHTPETPKTLVSLLANADLPYRHFLLSRRELSFARRCDLELPPEFLRFSKRRILRGSVIFGATLVLLLVGIGQVVFAWDKSLTAHGYLEEAKLETFERRKSEEANRGSVIEAASIDCDGYRTLVEKQACLIGAGIATSSLITNQAEDSEEIFGQLGVAVDRLPEFVRDDVDAPANPFVEPNNPAPVAEPSAPTDCEGWIWLGRSDSDFPNVDKGVLLKDKIWKGEQLKTTKRLNLRQDPPDQYTYGEGPIVGQIPAQGKVISKGNPQAIKRESGDQYWVHVEPANPNNCTTVFIQYVGLDARAQELRLDLRRLGYIVPNAERIPLASDLYSIRYFRKEDKDRANALAEDVANSLNLPSITAKYAQGAPDVSRHLEVWIQL